MSPLAIVLWIVAGALFLGAIAVVALAVRSTYRSGRALAAELARLSDDIEAATAAARRPR